MRLVLAILALCAFGCKREPDPLAAPARPPGPESLPRVGHEKSSDSEVGGADLVAKSEGLPCDCPVRVEGVSVVSLSGERNETVRIVQVKLTDPVAEREVNRVLKSVGEREQKEFRGAVEGQVSGGIALDVACSPEVVRGPFLGVVCNVYRNYGGAHPFTRVLGRNMWLCGAVNLTVDRICDDGGGCSEVLADLVVERFEKAGELGLAEMVFEPCEGCPSPLGEFLLEPSGMRVFLHERLSSVAVGKWGVVNLGFSELEKVFGESHNFSVVKGALRKGD